jgi:glycine/D-amino acid oxidase-like deaminating enzyme
MTRDHLPRLVTPEEGLHAAYGCNGRGVALMTMLGKLAAMRIAGQAPRDLPIAELPPAYYSLYALRVPAMLAARQFRHVRRALLRG